MVDRQPANTNARNRLEAVLIAGGPVAWPAKPATEHAPDLAHIRALMPDRRDRDAYLTHSLRFFEDVLAYAERLEREERP
jgi:hypothetical protein